MRRTWTIIGVGDVAGSLTWHPSLLGLPETAPAHDYCGQILDLDGTVLPCLHAWGAHEHPFLTSPDRAQPGNGRLLFFRVDDFDMALSRARALVTRLEEEPQVNPNTGTREFSAPGIRTGITSRSARSPPSDPMRDFPPMPCVLRLPSAQAGTEGSAGRRAFARIPMAPPLTSHFPPVGYHLTPAGPGGKPVTAWHRVARR